MLSSLLSILASAAVYAVLATAAVLVYRTNHVLSFHVGELGMLGAYAAVAVLPLAPAGAVGVAIGVLASMVVAAGVSVVMHVVVDRWGGARGPFVGTVLTIAAAIILLGFTSFMWSGEAKRFRLMQGVLEIGGARVAWNTIFVIVLCTVCVWLAQAVVGHSRLGISMRAVANSRRLAELRGIPVPRVLLVVWLISGLLTGIAGLTFASLSSVSMEGSFIGVSAIVAAILGGMTSLPGAIIGAVLLAGAEHLVTLHLDARYSQVVPTVILVAVLAIRPSGLSGRVETIARV